MSNFIKNEERLVPAKEQLRILSQWYRPDNCDMEYRNINAWNSSPRKFTYFILLPLASLIAAEVWYCE